MVESDKTYMRRSVSKVAIIVTALAGANILASAGRAGEPGPAGVIIVYHAPFVTVRVTHTTSLYAVLEKFCQHTQAHCEITSELAEAAAEQLVSPMTVEGAWAEVVTKLMEGRKLNYASLSPTRRERGELLVEARSPVTKAPQQEARGPVGAAGADEVVESGGVRMGRRRRLTSSADSRGGADAPGLSGGPSASSYRRARQPRLSDQSGTGVSFVQNPATVAFFPDASGGASSTLPTTESGSPVLPFPDSNGNPIPVEKGQPRTFLPFPDSNGLPIPVQPPAPGQGTRWPFPPSVTERNK